MKDASDCIRVYPTCCSVCIFSMNYMYSIVTPSYWNYRLITAICFTVMILSFWTDMCGQNVQAQIRQQRLHCLQFWLHVQYSLVKPSCLNFRVTTANFLGVRIFRIFTVMSEFFRCLQYVLLKKERENIPSPPLQTDTTVDVWIVFLNALCIWNIR